MGKYHKRGHAASADVSNESNPVDRADPLSDSRIDALIARRPDMVAAAKRRSARPKPIKAAWTPKEGGGVSFGSGGNPDDEAAFPYLIADAFGTRSSEALAVSLGALEYATRRRGESRGQSASSDNAGRLGALR